MAVTVVFAPTVTVQVAVDPVHEPPHPAKVFVPVTLSVSVTDAPC